MDEEAAVLDLPAPLATADPHRRDTCDAEGVPYIVLPDASGAVWGPVA